MQNKKAVFVLLDGLNTKCAKEHLGYLEHCSEKLKCAKYEVLGELPSASRPMYETIFTGLPVYEHGITNNAISRMSTSEHIFSLCQKNHKQTLVLAYHWIRELYVSTPFNPYTDCLLHDEKGCINDAIFYYEDNFPDSHLYSYASSYMNQKAYDFVFIHPMNIDDAGHRYGAGSKEYAKAVILNDMYLSTLIPEWVQNGYSVIVAADHGMSTDGYHGGNSEEQRRSALYIFDRNVKPGVCTNELTTLQMAPLLCHVLGIEPTSLMQPLEVDFDESA